MAHTEIRLTIFFAAKDGEALYSQKKTKKQKKQKNKQQQKKSIRDDCGSDHELLILKYRLKLKKVGKTTRPFRYDLNRSLTIIQWK